MVQEASKGLFIFNLVKSCKPKPLLAETVIQVSKPISKSFKALFLLERYIFFVSKIPTLIEISDIHQVIFSCVGTGAGASTGRTSDLKIVTILIVESLHQKRLRGRMMIILRKMVGVPFLKIYYCYRY